MKTEHLITLALVIAGVILAGFVAKKLNISAYEAYETE